MFARAHSLDECVVSHDDAIHYHLSFKELTHMRVPRRYFPASISSNVLRRSACLAAWVLVSTCITANAAESPDESIELTTFRTTPGELSEARAKAFYDLLAQSHLLARPTLSRSTLETIGDIMLRTHVDDERQMTYLDGFSGLWSRVGIDVNPLGYANLVDRIARKQGKPQSFGTLARSDVDYPASEAPRIYAAARAMIGMDPKVAAEPVHGKAPLAMAKPAYPELPKVREELLRLSDMDQSVRLEPPGGFKGEAEKAFIKRMQETDAYTLPKMRAIFDRYGIPTPRQVGRSGTHAAFLLIQHAISDPALMRGALAEVKWLSDQGALPGIDYALLADRIDCVLDHRPQQFGTQGTRNRKSHWFCPIADPEHVNQRRASLYLPAMDSDEIYPSDPDLARRP